MQPFTPPDQYFKAVASAIPAEVTTVYLAMMGFVIMSPGGTKDWLSWVVWGLCIIAAPLFAFAQGRFIRTRGNVKLHWVKAFIMAPVAFICWSLVMKSPFNTLGADVLKNSQLAGSILILVVSGAVFPLLNMFVLPRESAQPQAE